MGLLWLYRRIPVSFSCVDWVGVGVLVGVSKFVYDLFCFLLRKYFLNFLIFLWTFKVCCGRLVSSETILHTYYCFKNLTCRRKSYVKLKKKC